MTTATLNETAADILAILDGAQCAADKLAAIRASVDAIFMNEELDFCPGEPILQIREFGRKRDF